MSDFSKDRQIREIRKTTDKVRAIFDENDASFDENDEKKLLKEPPTKPNFPYIMMAVAVMKDVLDIPMDIGIFGIIFVTIFSFFLSIIMFFWCLGKMRGGWWKKQIIRWLWVRYAATIILEFIPFLNMIPAATIFILMAHYHETKLVRLFDRALEEFKNAGVLKYIG